METLYMQYALYNDYSYSFIAVKNIRSEKKFVKLFIP